MIHRSVSRGHCEEKHFCRLVLLHSSPPQHISYNRIKYKKNKEMNPSIDTEKLFSFVHEIYMPYWYI
jgi:hypothetical protein